MSKIVKTVSTNHTVDIELENGVVLKISSNKGSINFGFSGVDVPMNVHLCLPTDDKCTGSVPNTFNVHYVPINKG